MPCCRPRRAQLTLRCPKLSVMLQAPVNSAAPAVPVFEASLQQVCLALAAGTQAGEQLQSGAGPLTLEVTASSAKHCPVCSLGIQFMMTAHSSLMKQFSIGPIISGNSINATCRRRASRCVSSQRL